MLYELSLTRPGDRVRLATTACGIESDGTVIEVDLRTIVVRFDSHPSSPQVVPTRQLTKFVNLTID